jgi:hypothetical protein
MLHTARQVTQGIQIIGFGSIVDTAIELAQRYRQRKQGYQLRGECLG